MVITQFTFVTHNTDGYSLIIFIDPPVTYIQPVFRPPSEGHSLILQVTNGCSWNNCTFCEMYTAPQKKFAPKAEDKVLEEIKRCGESLPKMRIFIEHTDLDKSIFRSDHVSNHLVLKGVLGKDKQVMLDEIDDAIEHFKDHPDRKQPQVF